MATISITVGPITVERTVADDKAQSFLEEVSARTWHNMDVPNPTPKQRLQGVLDDVILYWFRLVKEADREEEHQEMYSRLTSKTAERSVTLGEWLNDTDQEIGFGTEKPN